MKVGDLARPRTSVSSYCSQAESDQKILGIIVEWPDSKTNYMGWVRWNSRPDWDYECEGDLEVISKSPNKE